MNLKEKLNTNQSIIGQELIDWINQDKENLAPDEQNIQDKLYRKYIMDRYGVPKNKIYPNVYYYVNYNNKFNPELYLAYIVRDKVRSPRRLPDGLAKLDITQSNESYKGSFIQSWAYFQNGKSENEYFMEGNEIVTKYLENSNPIRNEVYYFIAKTSKGIKIFRDTDKSPKPFNY